MIDNTFVTFGKAIASPQVIATKAAVRIKFLNGQLALYNLRFLIIIWLPKNESEKLIPKWIVVARECSKYNKTQSTSCN